ncbi:hypothetical protein RFI_01155 [Reticulomyxa filosa]|uniref:Uncharacterized protein n=1 Tax=Reticulomyxa filosa TaxID=46433 RepID=X6PCU7_RETFI|nr:hypothetical protein RFI_01155 [Reticulomyxa filosa]|eukprot:ETO35908.1 hypothetical protein RFI_01155 [Reticulomyxa filosa]
MTMRKSHSLWYVLYDHEQTKVHKQQSKQIRRRFTLITKILQNIINQMISGLKETFIVSLNNLIVEEISKVKKFFKEFYNVLPLKHHFAMDRKIREKSPIDDLDSFSMFQSPSSALNSDSSSKGDKGNLSKAAGGSDAIGNVVNGNLTGDTTMIGISAKDKKNESNYNEHLQYLPLEFLQKNVFFSLFQCFDKTKSFFEIKESNLKFSFCFEEFVCKTHVLLMIFITSVLCMFLSNGHITATKIKCMKNI